MRGVNWWVIGVAAVGTLAAIFSVGLLWLLFTHPAAVAQALANAR
jgi:hypothetical protein